METFDDNDAVRVDRRTAIKWVLAASAALQLPATTFAQNRGQASAGSMVTDGYGKDPNLLEIHKIGSLWPRTFNDAQRATAAVLCDLIIPADDQSPAASKVGVVDFIDEWISAPYPDNRKDKPIVIDGLEWLDVESQQRYSKTFVALSGTQRVEICDEISAPKPAARLAQAAAFFTRFRALTAGGYYTTPVGMKDLRYVGNVAMTTFEGPPPEVLKKLGLA
jgi:hypothetical protein